MPDKSFIADYDRNRGYGLQLRMFRQNFKETVKTALGNMTSFYNLILKYSATQFTAMHRSSFFYKYFQYDEVLHLCDVFVSQVQSYTCIFIHFFAHMISLTF